MIGQTLTQHKDPVCGMRLEEKDVQATATYQGKTYYFCSVACKQKFEHSPQKYAGADI
jgi:YHS domain-containing protein